MKKLKELIWRNLKKYKEIEKIEMSQCLLFLYYWRSEASKHEVLGVKRRLSRSNEQMNKWRFEDFMIWSRAVHCVYEDLKWTDELQRRMLPVLAIIKRRLTLNIWTLNLNIEFEYQNLEIWNLGYLNLNIEFQHLNWIYQNLRKCRFFKRSKCSSLWRR